MTLSPLIQIFLVLWVWYFFLTIFALIRLFYRIMQVFMLFKRKV